MTPVVLVVTALKIVFLALPLSVASLAFRRLLISRSSNAWLYGAVMLFAIVTTLGMLPWVSGISAPSAVFLIFAALSPMAWIAVLMLCGSRGYGMDFRGLEMSTNASRPLVLTDPMDPVVPTFRHSRPQSFASSRSISEVTSEAAEAVDKAVEKPSCRSLLTVAREMRGGGSQEPTKEETILLPPPAPEAEDLPFINRSATT